MRVFSRAAVVFASAAALCAAIASDAVKTNAAAPAGVRPYAAPPVFAPGGKRPSSAGRVSGCATQPETLSGQTVSLTLHIAYAHATIWNPRTQSRDPVYLRTYNGCVVAPTIETVAGGRLNILVDNALPANTTGCTPMDPIKGCWNTTNLHTHGFHVSPSGHADNVLVTVEPGKMRPTEIDLPPDHPAGTFWYHAHAHTSTAMQVTSGMAGVLIVRGHHPYAGPGKHADIDTILHDADRKPFPEQLLMLEQISYACFTDKTYQTIITTDGKPGSPWACPSTRGTDGVVENFQKQLFEDQAWKNSGRFTTVNGEVQPTLTATAGKIQRWRLIHGGINDSIELKIVKVGNASIDAATLSALHGTPRQQLATVNADCNGEVVPQYEIAADGLTRRHIQQLADIPGHPPANVLQPGYRSDVLVAFPSPGTYCVTDEAAKNVMDISTERSGLPRTRRLLAIVDVPDGDTVKPDLRYITQQLVDANKDLPEPVRAELAAGIIKPWSPFPDDLHSPVPSPACKATGLPLLQDGPLKCVFFQRKDRINGKKYDHMIPEPQRVRFQGTLGKTDLWMVTGTEHIYHIHVNPFQIYDIRLNGESIYDASGACKATAGGDPVDRQYCGLKNVYRDTLMIRDQYQALLLTRYDHFDGAFVIHCHILDHEDAGMMADMKIVP
jgi:FtsP/CotA-like multicopper oxidase with cupredoxin domain